MPLWGFLMSFLAAAMWAASPIMVNSGLARAGCSIHEVNPFRAVSFLAASAAVALISCGGKIPVVTSPLAWVYFFFSVITSYTLGDLFFFLAIREMGVSLAIPVANSYPILVIFTSWLMLGEPVTPKLIWGVAVVVGGLLLLRFGGEKAEHGEKPRYGAGQLMRGFSFALGGGLCWALASPVTKIAMNISQLGAAEITFYRAFAFMIVTLVVRILTVKFRRSATRSLSSVPPAAAAYFLSAAVVGLCFGSVVYAKCISAMPVAVVTAITATSPFLAALYGRFVLKESLAKPQWCGIVMIIAGSIVVGL